MKKLKASILLSLAIAATGCALPLQYSAVALTFPEGNNHCSATYVAPNTILAAAHCFWGDEMGKVVPQRFKVGKGEWEQLRVIANDKNDHLFICTYTTSKHYAVFGSWPAVGSRITMWGNTGQPEGLLYREGYISGDRKANDLIYEGIQHLFVLTSDGGDSGSGLFYRNRLVGMITGGSGSFSRALPFKFTPEQFTSIHSCEIK